LSPDWATDHYPFGLSDYKHHGRSECDVQWGCAEDRESCAPEDEAIMGQSGRTANDFFLGSSLQVVSGVCGHWRSSKACGKAIHITVNGTGCHGLVSATDTWCKMQHSNRAVRTVRFRTLTDLGSHSHSQSLTAKGSD